MNCAVNLEEFLLYTCDSIHHFLKCDLVAITQFKENWSGAFIIDSVGFGWVFLLEAQRKNPAIVKNVNNCSVQDLARKSQLAAGTTNTYIRASQAKIFEYSKFYRVWEDIYNFDFFSCETVVFDARNLMKCDRATIIKFNFGGDRNQECLAESLGSEFIKDIFPDNRWLIDTKALAGILQWSTH